MLQYTEFTPKQVNTVYTSYENQARLKFQTENETENETWHFSRWSERKGNHGFFCKFFPSSAKCIANNITLYIYKKKKKK